MNKVIFKHIPNKKIAYVLDILFTTVVAIIIAFGVRTFIGSPAVASGASMLPTIENGERVYINKLSYLFKEPQKDDIIVFNFSKNEKYIKRIIGLSGDRIDTRGNHIYVNGEKLEDDFQNKFSYFGDRKYPFIVEEGSFFVLGDNRDVSKDSRYISVGNVSKDQIIGRVDFKFYPLNKFEKFK